MMHKSLDWPSYMPHNT